MQIIVGLGNPGKDYEHTRHNAGFDALDKLADKHNITIKTKKFQALIGDGIINGKRVILMKPQTFMNLSGNAVHEIANFYNLTSEDFIVMYDDIDLDVGSIRVRAKGSAGGHNGIKSIIANLGSDKFNRVRIGVGAKKENSDLVDHVLGQMSKADRKEFDEALDKAVAAVEETLDNGITSAMNKFNEKKKKED
ncbi:MAG: aminoacyl-tRNA hydrolase [Clostridia bacterium]|nr:aminoacyl-tRNA hydrolase [Clostridia bacterium]